MTYAIHWFRNDFRLKDNIALSQCCNSGYPVMFIYIHDPNHPYKEADAHNVWLHHSLVKLSNDLEKKGYTLLIMEGKPLDCFKQIVKKAKPHALFYNECYDEANRKAEQDVHLFMDEKKILRYRYHGNLFCHPDRLQQEDGTYYEHFDLFWDQLNETCEERPLYPFVKAQAYPYKIHGVEVGDLNLIHSYHLDQDLKKHWKVGEDHALKWLRSFTKSKLTHYTKNRSTPSLDYTSRLSPYLNFGQISPYQVLHEVNDALEWVPEKEAKAFIRDIALREFSQYLLYHEPEMPHRPMKEEFVDYHWTENQHFFQAWKKGQTGYPIVDAAMRQLSSMGWCHPKARIIASSFLVKDLNIHWQEGQFWFFKNLFDADLATNSFNWQRMMGCWHDDQAHYQRFDPALESAKCDPKGEYIKKWVPELAKLPLSYMHTPWKAPAALLKKANITLGNDYPIRVIEHNKVAKEALKMLHSRSKNSPKVRNF